MYLILLVKSFCGQFHNPWNLLAFLLWDVADVRAGPKTHNWKCIHLRAIKLRQIYYSLSNSLIESIYQYTFPS